MAPRGPQRYRVAATTADSGLFAWGAGREELFANAAAGLSSLMVDPRRLRAGEEREVSAEGLDLPALLVAWLNEWVFLFDTEGFLGRDFEVRELSDTRVRGVGRGERYDPARHRFRDQVKAVTYHRLEVREEGGRLRARVVVDL